MRANQARLRYRQRHGKDRMPTDNEGPNDDRNRGSRTIYCAVRAATIRAAQDLYGLAALLSEQ